MKSIATHQINTKKWDALLSKSPFISPFQTPDFYTFCKQSEHISCEVFATENSAGEYNAVCLVTLQKEKGFKSYFSRRAIVYGGPLISNDCTSFVFGKLLNTLESCLRKKVIYIEVRNFHTYTEYKNAYNQHKWLYKPYLNIKVPLTFSSTNEVLRIFKYNRRREVRLSINAGLTYGLAKTTNEIGEIYFLLRNLYTKEVGLPLPSLQYFKDLWKTGILKVFIVKDEEKTVGGSFCLVVKNHAIYTYYYCGLRNYKPKTFPTHLAVLAAMEYGINNKLKYLDFMGAGLAGKDYGVRKYKKEFGGEVIEEGRYRKITNKPLYLVGVFAMKIIKKINGLR